MGFDGLTQDEAERQEQETAFERARGHVTELRRLWETGSAYAAAIPFFDQIEADLNTARPRHGGWAGYQAPAQGVVTSPTGLSGVASQGTHFEGGQNSQPFTERDAELEEAGRERNGEPVGADGLTDSERAS